jgi:putative ABC transport system permease protein
MNAVLTTIRSDLQRRRLQALVIAFVILLASGAATLALNLAVETDAPFDHAFARANGAHLFVTYAANKVSQARLKHTASAPAVTQTAGPWPQVTAPYSVGPARSGPVPAAGLFVVGRPSPDTSVDNLTMESGRWARSPGEAVISQNLADSWQIGVGDALTPDGTSSGGHHGPTLHVVGVAASVSPYTTDVWVAPGQIAAMVTTESPLQYQMLYRVTPAGTAAALQKATQSVTRGVPAGAVVSTSNYLDQKVNADLLSSVMVPFLLAFSACALLASVMIITNVVSGVVIASYRDIGIMKSVGFSPGQVTQVLLGLILAPTLLGCVLGIPLGTLASQPFLQRTAHALNLPAPFTAAVPVDLLVAAVIVSVATLAALLPAWRAGRLSAVTAITRGSAPPSTHGSGPGTILSRLPLPRPVSLGLADALARPLRTAMTMGAILVGVATVVFALSLHLSLGQVATHLIRDKYVQIDVQRPTLASPQTGATAPPGGPRFPRPLSDRQVTHVLRTDPDTARFVSETQENITVPGIAQSIPYYAYREPSSWIGYAQISGRWFSHPGEVVAPTKLISEAHLTLGQSFTAQMNGHAVRLRLVGEILDQSGNDLLLRGGWAALHAADPRAQPDTYEVQVRQGLDPVAYQRGLYARVGVTGPGPAPISVDTVQGSSSNTDFLLLNGVIAALALVLTAIAVAGVFNTVILSTREKVRDVAILKAVGMAPAQVISMVVASIALLGLVAGLAGIPIGLTLHAQILAFMGQAASGTRIPPAFFDLINHAVLPFFALAGMVIAAIGAWFPARWAASRGVTEVLQTE